MKVKREYLKIMIVFLISLGLSLSCAHKPAPIELQSHKPLSVARYSYPYILNPGDEIEIHVRNHPEFSGNVPIYPDGIIELPNIHYRSPNGNKLKAAGLNREDLADKISEFLRYYIKDPAVTVRIAEYKSKKVYVFGEVGRPGIVYMEREGLTVRDAIIKAGLPTTYAAASKVHIISPDPKETSYQVVNLKRILYKGQIKENLILKPDDIVYVPSLWITKVNFWLNQLLHPIFKVAALTYLGIRISDELKD